MKKITSSAGSALTAWQRQVAQDIAAAHPLTRDVKLLAFTVQIKRGSAVRLEFEAMGADSMAVAEQHEGLCEDGEYVNVRPAFSDDIPRPAGYDDPMRRAVEHQQNMLRQLQGGGW